MICQQCGCQNDNGFQFCRACGARLAPAVMPPQANVPPQASVPTQVNAPLKPRRRDITVKTRVFFIINAIFGMLVVLLPLLPLTVSTNRNVFTEKATVISIAYNLQSRGYASIGAILLSIYICSIAAIIAGIVLSFLRFKGSAFCILSGSLYPFLYSFQLMRSAIGYHDCPDKASPICILYFLCALLAIITSALALGVYRVKSSS